MKLGPASKRPEVAEPSEEFASADVSLVCYEELTDRVTFAQLNSALNHEPEDEDDDEDTTG